MEDPRIPSYYVASPDVAEDRQPEVVGALRIHPIHCAIIWRDQDRDLAALLGAPEIIRTNTEKEAHELAAWMPTKCDSPALVIGGSQILEAVYTDGEREVLCN